MYSGTGNAAFFLVYCALFFVGYISHNPPVLLACLVLIAIISLFAWAFNYRRARAISAIAVSRIASAAQGYVELCGRASNATENLVISPLSGAKCIWFHCSLYEKDANDNWCLINKQISHQTIQIDDSTGSCQVDPDDAEIIGASCEVTYHGPLKQVERLLYGGGNLYVLGEFSTIGGAASVLNLKEDVGALLTSWKQDKQTLYKRFDLNRNGEIDLQEWELARRAATHETLQQHRETRAQSGVNVVSVPRNKELFLISSVSPQYMRRKFMFWAMLYLGIALLAATVLFYTQ